MNEYGQCSIKKIEEVKKPTLVTDLNLRVSLIDCGYYHTALITSKTFLELNENCRIF